MHSSIKSWTISVFNIIVPCHCATYEHSHCDKVLESITILKKIQTTKLVEWFEKGLASIRKNEESPACEWNTQFTLISISAPYHIEYWAENNAQSIKLKF